MLNSTESPVLLADEIAVRIRKNIQNGVYPPDSRLTVRRLCEEFDASETPVKQALNQLLSTGLVVSIPKCGMRVAAFDLDAMKRNLEARMMVELYCSKHAVEKVRGDPEFADRLRSILDISNKEYEACAQKYTPEAFTELNVHDHQLHMSIIESCENDQIISIYKQLNSHELMYTGARVHTPETLKGVITQHTAIVEALIKCEERKLETAIRKHIGATMDVYARLGT